jgi:OmpA-OmpF porin, OOP family
VPNGGFEEYVKCPGDFSRASAEFRAREWYAPTGGTPDLFNTCSHGQAGVPHNWAGVADAYEGLGYAGIYLYMAMPVENYREYLQCKLNSLLIKDSTYRVEFRFKLSSYSMYAIDRIGVVLSDAALKAKHDRVLPVKPTLVYVQDSALNKETGYWQKFAMEYKARGTEQFITIGNFGNDEETRTYKIKFQASQQEMLAYSAYYYIDDVQVMLKFPPPDPLLAGISIHAFGEESTTLDKTYVLKNIQFHYDSYKLMVSSFEELDRLVYWLHENPTVKVLLSGHTDNRGSDRYNLVLSLNRAKSVAAYLKAHGISAHRIETYGYGKERPLIDAQTEEAQAINRRVEVKFVR